jgi:hypothetical protein
MSIFDGSFQWTSFAACKAEVFIQSIDRLIISQAKRIIWVEIFRIKYVGQWDAQFLGQFCDTLKVWTLKLKVTIGSLEYQRIDNFLTQQRVL